MTSRFSPAAFFALALVACGGSETEPSAETNAGATTQAANEQVAANAAESIRTRQQHYKEIGRAMKAINDELKKSSPDLAVIQSGAATIDRFAPEIRGWFPDGTGAGAGVETEAREEIWSKPDEFRAATERIVAQAAQFNTVAQGGDLDAIRASLKELGGACKNCHDQFRAEKE